MSFKLAMAAALIVVLGTSPALAREKKKSVNPTPTGSKVMITPSSAGVETPGKTWFTGQPSAGTTPSSVMVTPGKAIVTPSSVGETPGKAIVTPSKAGETPGKAIVAPSKAGETPGKAIETPSSAMGPGAVERHPPNQAQLEQAREHYRKRMKEARFRNGSSLDRDRSYGENSGFYDGR